MIRHSLLDELDKAVDSMVANEGCVPPVKNGMIHEMLDAASELRVLASGDFKARLKSELLERALQGAVAIPRPAARTGQSADVLPTLFAAGYGSYPVQRANFAASLCLHAAALLLMGFSGIWMTQRARDHKQQVVTLIADTGSYTVPPAAERAGGGGGGGDADRLAASKGNAPRFAREQIAAPAVVVRNETPKLAVEPTVVGPPQLVLPHGQLGDPLSAVLSPPSNGTGTGGGIGSGSGGGVGSGRGPGVGPGTGGGVGGGVYRIGGGVSAPKALYAPDPEYSDEARKAKYQGIVVLWVVVGADGRPREIRVARALGMGLDEKAIEAVRTWRFEPAHLNDRPVAVQMNVEVSFRLY